MSRNQLGRSDIYTWSHPVVANGRLYIRDQAALLSYDVKQNPTSVRAAAARRKPDFAVFPLSPLNL